MSQILTPEQLKSTKVCGMLIDDTAFFNLQVLQAGLGLTSDESAKKWCLRHRVKPSVTGRTWLFTGRTFREAIENLNRETEEADELRHVRRGKPATLPPIEA